MISASHNPPDDNGIKFFGANGSKLSLALQEQIEVALRGKSLLGQVGNMDLSLGDRHLGDHAKRYGQHYYRPELLNDYLTAIQQPLLHATDLPLQGMRIVLDLAWGAAVHLAPQAFWSLGATVICLHDAAGW